MMWETESLGLKHQWSGLKGTWVMGFMYRWKGGQDKIEGEEDDDAAGKPTAG